MITYLTPHHPLRVTRSIMVKTAVPESRVYFIKNVLKHYRAYALAAGFERSVKKLLPKIVGAACGLLVRRVGSDLVVMLNPLGVRVLKRMNPSVKVVVDYMDVMMDWSGRILLNEALDIGVCDGVIFWSRRLMEYVTSVCRVKKYTYIPYGISLRLFNPSKIPVEKAKTMFGAKGYIIVGYSGGVWKPRGFKKELQGVHKIPKIIAGVIEKCGNVLFALNSPYDETLFKMLKKHGVLNRTLWLKPTKFNHPIRQAFFAACDILLLPSSEYPTVFYAERMKMFEYMASGRAIVAEETPGITSVLNGASVMVRFNDINEMAETVVELIDNGDLRRELGYKALSRLMEKYEWSVLAPKYRSFIQELLEDYN